MQVATPGCATCPVVPVSGLGDWSQTFQDMLTSWSKAGQQILLNLNQPKVYESTPTGTTVYSSGTGGALGPVGSQRTVTPAENVVGQISTTTLLVVGGIVIVAMMMFRKEE